MSEDLTPVHIQRQVYGWSHSRNIYPGRKLFDGLEAESSSIPVYIVLGHIKGLMTQGVFPQI